MRVLVDGQMQTIADDECEQIRRAHDERVAQEEKEPMDPREAFAQVRNSVEELHSGTIVLGREIDTDGRLTPDRLASLREMRTALYELATAVLELEGEGG
jgi:hypothetical protein